jgi:hypothetical protein
MAIGGIDRHPSVSFLQMENGTCVIGKETAKRSSRVLKAVYKVFQ